MTEIADLTKAVEALVERVEGAPITSPFSASEIETIRRVTQFFVRLETLGWWGKKAAWIIGGLAVLLTQFDRIRAAAGWSP